MAHQSTYVDLTENEPDSAQALNWVRTDNAGGICLFVGTTRRESNGRLVERLSYEAYRQMAMGQMTAIAQQAVDRWGLERCYVSHRLGDVPVGDISVVIAVSAPHRAEAFQACRYVIDELKSRVPVWKKELFAEGGAEWVEGDDPQ